MARTISTKLAVEGEAQYKQAIASCNSELSTLKSSLALVESEFRGNANSMEAITAKGAALDSMYKKQQEKVSTLEAALRNAQRAQEEYASRVSTAQSNIERCERALETLRRSTGDTTEEQEALTKELDKWNSELEEAKAGQAAAERGVQNWQKQLNNAKVELNGLSDEIDKNNGYLDEARNSADGCADSIDEFGNEVDNSKKGIEQLAAALAAAGVAKTIKEIADALLECAEAAAGFETAMAKVSTLADTTVVPLDSLGGFSMSTTLYPGIPFSPQATLTNNIGAADSIIEVSNVSAFPPAPNLATIGTDEEGETILYTAKTETALSGCQRGVEGTAKAWTAGELIGRNFTAKDHADLISAVTETRDTATAAAGAATAAGTAATNAQTAAQAAQEAAAAAEGKATTAATTATQAAQDAAQAKEDAQTAADAAATAQGAAETAQTAAASASSAASTAQAAATEALETADEALEAAQAAGGLYPQIIVTVAAGAVVTCSSGSKSYEQTSTGAAVVFNVPDYGTWSVSAERDGLPSNTVNVVVDTAKQYAAALAFFESTITVNVEAGSSVVCEGGGKTQTKTSETGSVVFTVTSAATYTITATTGDETTTGSFSPTRIFPPTTTRPTSPTATTGPGQRYGATSGPRREAGSRRGATTQTTRALSIPRRSAGPRRRSSRIIASISPGSGPSVSAASTATAPTRGRSASTATTRRPTPAASSARAFKNSPKGGPGGRNPPEVTISTH